MWFKNFACFLKICMLVLLLPIISTSCEPEESEIGLDIVNKGSYLPKRDTLYVTATSMFQDSILTSNITDSQTIPIGCLYDPLFGKTSSSLAVAFGLSSENPQFDETTVVDSVVLSLAYAGSIFGDNNCNQTFRVFELGEVLSGDYYSNRRCVYKNVELGSKTFLPSLDSVIVDGNLVDASLQIKLDNSVGERLINADTANLVDDESFIEIFNGLYITPDVVNTPNSGSMSHFYLEDDLTYIKIYYHNSQNDSLSYKLNVSEDLARYVEFNHNDYQDASPEVLDAIGDSLCGEEKLYLQSMSGMRVKLDIQGLDSIAKQGVIAVSNAVITFHIDGEENFYTVPTDYDLVRINPDNTATIISDYSVGSSHYGGDLVNETSSVSFRLTSQLQQFFYGTAENCGLYLVLSNSSYLPRRSVVYGSNPSDSSKRIMIDLTYSVVVPE